jgi:hypothetical protein
MAQPGFGKVKMQSLVFKLFSPKAAEFSGVAEEFPCHSLQRSEIYKDL